MSEESSFRYFNKNNGDVAEYPHRHARLEFLQNWVSVEDDDHLASLQSERDGTRSARGNLLGSSNVGDRIEERHQIPPGTFEPKIEYTDPSINQLPGNHPDPEAFHPELQPEVVTLDPSQQVKPKTGPDKRDLSAQPPTDEQLDLTPGSKPIGAGSGGGVLARAHPEMEGVEERRQQLISEQQDAKKQGDPDAGQTAVQGRTDVNPDDASTDATGRTSGTEPQPEPETAPGPNPANRPARSASKDAWIDWAVEAGADRDEAKSMTKQDLIEVYGE